MNETRKQKRIASLVKEEVSRLIVEEVQDFVPTLITVTRVEVSKNLQTAYVYLTLLDKKHKQTILNKLEQKSGYLRKSIASVTKLKYNPKLIFSYDVGREHKEKIDKILDKIKKNGE